MELDPCRPVYHYSSGCWMNDVIPFHDGQRLHVFFDHNPKAAEWTRFHWGHATTDDLVHWSTLPVALSPTPGGPDAYGCWTGSVFSTDEGVAAAYTGIRSSYPPLDQVQCLATSSDLERWQQGGPPVIAEAPAGYGECFRDPFVWHADGVWRMLVGSTEQKSDVAAVLLYESPDLLSWDFAGPLYIARDGAFGRMAECPELFELDGRSVLAMSCGQTRGVAGHIDGDGTFVPDGPVKTFDPGESYAARSVDVGGRRVQLAWLRDTRSFAARKEAGWSGALSLPRDVSLDRDGALSVAVAPEVEGLRRERVCAEELRLETSRCLVPGISRLTFEAMIELDVRSAGHTGVAVGCHPDGTGGVDVVVDWVAGSVAGHDIGALDRETSLTLRLFVDQSVIEVFALGTVVTLRDYELTDAPRIALWADRPATARVTGWHLGP